MSLLTTGQYLDHFRKSLESYDLMSRAYSMRGLHLPFRVSSDWSLPFIEAPVSQLLTMSTDLVPENLAAAVS